MNSLNSNSQDKTDSNTQLSQTANVQQKRFTASHFIITVQTIIIIILGSTLYYVKFFPYSHIGEQPSNIFSTPFPSQIEPTSRSTPTPFKEPVHKDIDVTGEAFPIAGTNKLRYPDSIIGFSIDFPASWKITHDNIYYMTSEGGRADFMLEGNAGEIYLNMRTARGDSCSVQNGKPVKGEINNPYTDFETLTINGKNVDICHGVEEDGTEIYEVQTGDKDFDGDLRVFADVNPPSSKNKQTVIDILESFKAFPKGH